jgi:hypothetical protein
VERIPKSFKTLLKNAFRSNFLLKPRPGFNKKGDCSGLMGFYSTEEPIRTTRSSERGDLPTTIPMPGFRHQGYDHVVLFLTLIICNLIVFH